MIEHEQKKLEMLIEFIRVLSKQKHDLVRKGGNMKEYSCKNCKNNYFGGALKRNKKCKKCVVDSKNIYGKPSNYEERDKM